MTNSWDDHDDDYDSVGYGRPPKHAQFKPGQSGNPLGRPRLELSLEDAMGREMKKPVVIKEGNQVSYVSGMEALLRKLLNEGFKGNIAAWVEFLQYRDRKHNKCGQIDILVLNTETGLPLHKDHGRPSGKTESARATVDILLAEMMEITETGKTRTVTKQEAMCSMLKRLAFEGDRRARKILRSLLPPEEFENLTVIWVTDPDGLIDSF